MWKTVLFDLDGTLTDSAEGITKCVQHALVGLGLEAPELTDLNCFVGPPLHEMFMNYADLDEETADRAVELYRERYVAEGMFENHLYPKITKLLELLEKHGITMGVASSKPEVYVEQILEHFGIAEYFDYVSGIELQGEPLSKHGVIRLAMEKLGVSDPGECIMVGDRFHDVEGAQLSHMESVMVLYGYGDAAEAERCGATYTAGSVEELEALLLG